MRRPHTLNFILVKFRQKWQLIGQWQLTDLEDGYFMARFHMREDLEFVLTGGPLARGRFARIYVDLDITQPLKSSLEVDNRSIKVEYENLGLIYFKCGRVGHNKEACLEDVLNRKEGAQVSEDKTSSGATSNVTGLSEPSQDNFGPWLQASYRRNGRNNMGLSFGGKISALLVGSGKASNDTRQGNGSPSHGAEIYGKLTKPPRILVLTKISNREGSKKKQVPYTVSKYKVSAGTNKGLLNRPLKENLSGVHEGTMSKSINKGKQISIEMDEDLEDSDVLKILYKDMLDSVVIGTGSISPSPNLDRCISSPESKTLYSQLSFCGYVTDDVLLNNQYAAEKQTRSCDDVFVIWFSSFLYLGPKNRSFSPSNFM
ncbi:hypothetical protein LWI29_016800 [Acer saccharum]|uniref:Zinc knuckle CX2CX4HX4C domain-containing protein n=1 Tax=Acer saccharum TaxID=4024 RepID=A0AA39VQV9_ACESA|nr:hypothetical protein LWI29_016800 [Acer saccharum]